MISSPPNRVFAAGCDLILLAITRFIPRQFWYGELILNIKKIYIVLSSTTSVINIIFFADTQIPIAHIGYPLLNRSTSS
jgi:hypothetical protein